MTRIRIGTPIRRFMVSHLLRHLEFFEKPLGLDGGFELLDFALQHPEFISRVLGDADDALHFEKLGELSLAQKLLSENSIGLI